MVNRMGVHTHQLLQLFAADVPLLLPSLQWASLHQCNPVHNSLRPENATTVFATIPALNIRYYPANLVLLQHLFSLLMHACRTMPARQQQANCKGGLSALTCVK